ncbi:MAG: hypothetical protein DRI89_04735 [Bacteroidetes bacterium]|nr:MAG: hypothetical protein DRI89_04735 [Bacteroidota bacterium]
MKINRNNYEAFLIDYLDGTLDAVVEAELLLFLENNPDIREEFEGLEDVSLESQNIRFGEKSFLKKTEIKTIAGIGENNFEDYFIAFYENDLSIKETNKLQEFLITNPHLQTEFELHKKLLLHKDESTVYLHKEKLKKKPAIGIWWISGTGLAAAIALLFALFNLMKPNEPIRQHEQFVLVRLAPKTLTELSVASSPFIMISRDKQTVQKEIQAVELLAYETNSITKLNSKEIAVNLNSKEDFTPLVPQNYNEEILADAESEGIPKEKKRGALGRVLNRNVKLLAQRFTKREKDKTSDPTFVKILDGSITAFNTVTGSEVEMTKEYDQDGRLTGYQVEGETLSVNRSIPNTGSEK